MDYEKILPSTTWYHATRDEIKDSKYLNIDQNSKLVNSVVISEVSSQYAPKGYSLIASTALSTLKETEVKKDLAQIWGASTKPWALKIHYHCASHHIFLVQKFQTNYMLPATI